MVDEFDFPLEIVRSNRKRSACIQLTDAGVLVRVPKTLSDSHIRSLIARRSAWIKQKLNEAKQAPPVKPKEYVSGESFSYLGRNYRLKVLSGDAPSITLQNGYLQTIVCKADNTPQDTIRALLAGWYREQANRCLQEKTERFAKIIGVQPRLITVKDYKSRWGACSVSGHISYNWRIILAPHHIVDYVIVHELCHLREHNHSARYWQYVERYIPDYKQRRQWLKSEASRLLI